MQMQFVGVDSKGMYLPCNVDLPDTSDKQNFEIGNLVCIVQESNPSGC